METDNAVADWLFAKFTRKPAETERDKLVRIRASSWFFRTGTVPIPKQQLAQSDYWQGLALRFGRSDPEKLDFSFRIVVMGRETKKPPPVP